MSLPFVWQDKLDKVSTPENIGLGAATGEVKGFCRVCGHVQKIPLHETSVVCEKCKAMRRFHNPFRR